MTSAEGRESGMDYRHEVKHLISPGDAAAIRTNLSAVAVSVIGPILAQSCPRTVFLLVAIFKGFLCPSEGFLN